MKRSRINNKSARSSENTTVLNENPGPSSSELQFNRSHPVSGPRPTGRRPTLHLSQKYDGAEAAPGPDDSQFTGPPAKR